MMSEHKRHPHVSCERVLFLGAFARSQGITTDGESYYFSSKCSLIKTELDGVTRLSLNANAIPRELKDEYGSKHIGGISYYDGKIYVAIEDSKVWNHPIIALYDANTLDYTGEYYELPAENHEKGLPWVAVDAQNGCVYTAPRDHSPCLIVYSLENMEFIKEIDLSERIHKIQGGEVHGGYLYTATDDETQAVFKTNVKTGETVKLFDRNLTSGSEGEGLTIFLTQDGSFIHTLDMGPLFINANIRHYKEIAN